MFPISEESCLSMERSDVDEQDTATASRGHLRSHEDISARQGEPASKPRLNYSEGSGQASHSARNMYVFSEPQGRPSNAQTHHQPDAYNNAYQGRPPYRPTWAREDGEPPFVCSSFLEDLRQGNQPRDERRYQTLSSHFSPLTPETEGSLCERRPTVPLDADNENHWSNSSPMKESHASSGESRAIRSDGNSLKRKLFPRLVALRLAAAQWDDHMDSGRWHTDFILARANAEDLEDYRAMLAVVPSVHLISSESTTSSIDRRKVVCVLEALDALRCDLDPGFRPMSHTQLLHGEGGLSSQPQPLARNTAMAESRSGNSRWEVQGSDTALNQARLAKPNGSPSAQREEVSLDESPEAVSVGLSPGDNHPEEAEFSQPALPVDTFFPYRKKYHVFTWGRTEWTAHLQREDHNGSRQFFVMQLLEKNTAEEYVFHCRWGRDEEDGNTNFRKVEHLKEGRRLFEDTFELKTGNKWSGSALRTLPRFIPTKGKYVLIDDIPHHISLALPLRGILETTKRH